MDPKQLIIEGHQLKMFYFYVFAVSPFIGMFVLWLWTRLLDWMLGWTFRDMMIDQIIRVSGAMQGYFAARWLGGCFVLGCSLLGLSWVLAS